MEKLRIRCPECGGENKYSDYCEQLRQTEFRGWRCVLCGEGQAIPYTQVKGSGKRSISEYQNTSVKVPIRKRATFMSCPHCDTYFEWDEGTSTYDGDYRVCDSCLEDNYTYSHSRDTYITTQDYEDDQEEEEDQDPEYEHIGSYHSSKRNLGHIPSSYDMRSPRVLLGLELEIEVSDDYDKDGRAGLLLDNMSDYRDEDGIRHTYCLMEEDGSLDNGFEMVTAYTGLDVHKAQLQYFKNRTAGLTSHDTSTCGLHVHVCKSSMTTLHAAKMVLFINYPDSVLFSNYWKGFGVG
jgi:hypothetical protein